MAKVNIEAKIFKQIQLNSTIKMVELIAPEIANQAEPGQFVNMRVTKQTAPLLRRPLGIADINIPRGSITLMYRILGEATNILADMQSGDKVGILGPLGNGFDIKAEKPLIVGGGLGLAPLLSLAKFGFGNGRADVLIAGRNEKEVGFWRDLYKPVSQNIYITSDDGSVGTKGNVMAEFNKLVLQDYDCIYVCGPNVMMHAVADTCLKNNKKCQVSLERYMACGLGACLGCSCESNGRRVKVCQNGPVFWAGEVSEW